MKNQEGLSEVVIFKGYLVLVPKHGISELLNRWLKIN